MANPPTPDNTAAQLLLDEIAAEVKAAQLSNFLKKYGKAAAALVLALVLGTAVFSTWQHYRQNELEKSSAVLGDLLDKNLATLTAAQTKALGVAYADFISHANHTGQKTIARLAEAGFLQKTGNVAQAIDKLQALHDDHAVAPLYRDYALLLAAQLRLDRDAPQPVLASLAPLLNAGNPWQISALGLAALLYGKMGDKEQALAQVKAIIEAPNVPVPVRTRALQLQHLYSAS